MAETETENEEVTRLREGLKAAHGLIDLCEESITELVGRVLALETSLMALQLGAGDGSRHKNDGGWFD